MICPVCTEPIAVHQPGGPDERRRALAIHFQDMIVRRDTGHTLGIVADAAARWFLEQ